LIHNNITDNTDKNSNIIGELVIELKSTSGDKSYVCFLLEKPPPYGSPPSSDVDKLLSLTTSNGPLTTDIVINSSITSQQTAIVYNNAGSNIFIFTNTITINNDSVKIINGYDTTISLFSANAPTDYVIIPNKNISMAQDEQIYIDCNPTGESSETINTYNIPVRSDASNEKQEMDYMKTSVNFALFSVLLIVSYFIVPSFYKFMVIFI
jgi:hypothetical protein